MSSSQLRERQHAGLEEFRRGQLWNRTPCFATCVTLRNTTAPQSTIFRRCTTPLSALSSTSTLPVEQHAVAINQQHLGLTWIAPQPSVGQERLNSVVEGLGWLAIGWLGRRRPRRSINCTDGNRVNSGRGKSLTAGAIQRSYGDI